MTRTRGNGKLQSEGSPTLDADQLAANLVEELRVPCRESEARFTEGLDQLLAVPIEATTAQQVGGLLAAVEHFHGQSDFVRAHQAVERAAKIADHLHDEKLLRRVASNKGILLFDNHEYAAAIEAHAEALAYATKHEDLASQLVAWNNVSLAYLDAGLEEESIACCQHGLELRDQLSPGKSPTFHTELGASLYANMAAAALQIESYRTGLSAIQKAATLRASIPAHSVNQLASASRIEACYARLLVELNVMDNAKKHADLASTYAANVSSEHATVPAEIVQGLIEIREGEVEAGLQRLHAIAEKATTAALLRESLLSLADAYDSAGSPDMSLSYLNKVAEHDRLSQRRACERAYRAFLKLQPTADASAKGKCAIALIDRLAVASELREDVSGAHPLRVGRLAYLLAKWVGETHESAESISVAARLHDLGKVGIPSRILLRSDPLTEAQRRFVQDHSGAAESLLFDTQLPHYDLIAETTQFHHEAWDGSGYPEGLANDRIPLAARITAICDSFDSLIHARRRRPAVSLTTALDHIKNMSGKQFDPDLVSAFVPQVLALAASLGDIDSIEADSSLPPFLAAHRRIKASIAGDHTVPPVLSFG